MKRLFKSIALILLLGLAVYSCNKAESKPQEENVPVLSVSVSPQEISLRVNESATVVASVIPSNATDKTVKWSSEDTSIASVGEDGVVTALNYGTVSIIAAANGVKGICRVSVLPNGVNSVSVSPSAVTLTSGDTYTLTASVLPEDASDKSLKWESSNSSVATVNENGIVLAVAPGNATISAKSSNNVKGECQVTVNPPYSFTVQRYSTESADWVDVGSGGIVSFPGDCVPVRLVIVSDDGRAVTWIIDDEQHAKYEDGKVYLLAPGTATLTVDAGGATKKVQLCSNIEKSFTIGELNCEPGVKVKVAKGTTHLIQLEYSNGQTILPVPAQVYTLSAMTPGLLTFSGLKPDKWEMAVGETTGESIVKLTMGSWSNNLFTAVVPSNQDMEGYEEIIIEW